MPEGQEFQEISKAFQALGNTAEIQRGQFNNAQAKPDQPELVPVVKSHRQMMYESFPDGSARKRVEDSIKASLQSNKVDTSDIGSFLQSTLAPNAREVLVMNEDTPASNIVSAYTNQELYATDWLYLERTRKFSGLAARRNPEDRTMTDAASVAPTYDNDVNVVEFVGENVEVSFMADSQASQQQSVDLMRQQVVPVLNSINRRWEYDLLYGILQPNPKPPNIPQFGGILEQIVTNVDDSGSAAVVEEQLEAINKTLGDVAGMGKQKMFLTSYLTTGTIRDIMIERYNGNNPRSFQEANAILAGKFNDVRVRADQVYEPIAGPPIPVVQSDLLQNVLIAFILDPELMPNWVRFRFKGNAGPQMFMNYDKQTRLIDGQFILEGRSVDRGPEHTKAKQTRVL